VTIDAYLRQLEQSLPRSARPRALPEIREHLRDGAARHEAAGNTPLEAEVAATRDFGPVEDVARRLGVELAVRETRVAALAALAATAFFVFPLYVVPENTLPPATWAEKPSDIALLQDVSVGFWILACVLTLVGAAVAWTRVSRLAAPLALCAAVAIAASLAAEAALVVRWFALTQATPNWALAAPLALASFGVCLGAALWARSSSRRLVKPLAPN